MVNTDVKEFLTELGYEEVPKTLSDWKAAFVSAASKRVSKLIITVF